MAIRIYFTLLISLLVLIAKPINAQSTGVSITNDGSDPTIGTILDVKGSGDNHFVIDDTDGNVGIGEIAPSEKLDVDGNVKLTGEVFSTNANASDTVNMLPIAYGVINPDGTIASGTGNYTCTWSATYNNYVIEFTGLLYDIDKYVTLVTPISGAVRTATTQQTSTSNKLLVYIWDLVNNDKIADDFSFVVFKP